MDRGLPPEAWLLLPERMQALPVREFTGGPQEEDVNRSPSGKARQRFTASPYLVLKRATMRMLLLLCCVLSGGLISAQNWALINPDYKYNYSNEGSEMITDQVIVTRIDTLGPDSFQYELNEFARHCETCDPTLYSTSCVWGGQEPILQAGIPHALGNKVIEDGLDWWITEMAGSMLIKPHATVGTSWISPLGGMALLFAADTMSLFGILDSVKFIAFSGGDSLLLTKTTGMAARWAASTSYSELIGLDGGLQLGQHLPEATDYFAHQIGDVLEYSKSGHYEDANCVHYTSGWITYRCIQRMDLLDTIVLTYRTIEQQDETGYTIPGPPEPCGSEHYSWIDTITIQVARGSMMSVHHFNPDLEIGTWPGAFGFSNFLNASDSMRTWMIIGSNSMGRTTLGTPFEVPQYSNLFCTSDQSDSILIGAHTNWWISSTFAEGLGLVDEVRDGIIAGSRRHLVGYIINGDTTGLIHSDPFLLSTSEAQHLQTSIELFPNPASDHITVIGAQAGNTIRIQDIEGRLIRSAKLASTDDIIDISDLKPGMYFLNVKGSAPLRFVIAR